MDTPRNASRFAQHCWQCLVDRRLIEIDPQNRPNGLRRKRRQVEHLDPRRGNSGRPAEDNCQTRTGRQAAPVRQRNLAGNNGQGRDFGRGGRQGAVGVVFDPAAAFGDLDRELAGQSTGTRADGAAEENGDRLSPPGTRPRVAQNSEFPVSAHERPRRWEEGSRHGECRDRSE